MKKTRLFQSINRAVAVLLLTGTSFAFAQPGQDRRERPAHTQQPQGGNPQRQNRPQNMQRPNMRPAAPVTAPRDRPIRQNPQPQVANRPSFNRPTVNNRPDNVQRPPVYRPVPGNRPAYNANRPQNVQRYPNNAIVANRGNNNFNRPGYRPVAGNHGYTRLNYSRPPVVYGNRRLYTHYNYAYHPYRPRIYGSYYHPIGFFTAALSLGAISLMLDNHSYRYDQGVYYQPYNNGYRVIPAPEGATIGSLPDGYTTVPLGNETFYYFAGTFYDRTANGYTVIDAPAGAIVYDLPEGCTELKIGNITYLQFNETVFQPIVIDGENAYEVVDLEENDNDQ